MKGGELIAKGSYGCVYNPSIRCLGESKRRKGVSKLMKRRDAKDEVAEQQIVDIIDPDYRYHLKPSEICKIGDLDEEDNIDACSLTKGANIDNLREKYRLLQMENGGISMTSLINKIHEIGGSMTESYAIKITMSLENLFEGLVDFFDNQYVHFDIKPDNIVYNEATNRFNFIDFGLSISSKSIGHVMGKRNNMFSRGYFIIPIETNILLEFSSMQPEDLKDDVYLSELSHATYSGSASSYKLINKGIAESDLYLKPFVDDVKKYGEIGEKYTFKEIAIKMVEKIDIYSLGISLVFLFTAFTNTRYIYDMGSKIRNEGFVKDFAILIDKMIKPVFEDRITPRDALKEFRIFKAKYTNVSSSSDAAASASGQSGGKRKHKRTKKSIKNKKTKTSKRMKHKRKTRNNRGK